MWLQDERLHEFVAEIKEPNPAILDVNKGWGIVSKRAEYILEVQSVLDFQHFAQLLSRLKT